MQYTIQNWANRHIFLARILLIVLHTILGYAAYFTALNVADNLQIPLSLVFTPLLISVLLLLKFHKKEAPKAVAPILIGLRMLFWFFVGIQLSHFADEKTVVIQEDTVHFATYKSASDNTIKSYVLPVNKFLSAWKKLIQRDKRWVKFDPEPDTSLVILGTILGVIAIILLTLYLACSLSCSGSEAAALIVLLFGVASIVGLIYLAMDYIENVNAEYRKKQKKKLREQGKSSAEKAPPPPPMPKKDTPPSVTQKVEPPKVAPTTPKKKVTPKERRYEKRLDKGVFLAKILTAIVLGGLIIFTIISS